MKTIDTKETIVAYIKGKEKYETQKKLEDSITKVEDFISKNTKELQKHSKTKGLNSYQSGYMQSLYHVRKILKGEDDA